VLGPLSGAILVAVAVLCRSAPDAAGSDRSFTTGGGEAGQDLEAQSRELDRQLELSETNRALQTRLSDDLLARRRTLPEAATLLTDFTRQRRPEWLRFLGRRYPNRSEEASVVANLVYRTRFRLRNGEPADQATARRPAADYRACDGIPLPPPEPAKGAALPPCWRRRASAP
jgi:hypothetical protein